MKKNVKVYLNILDKKLLYLTLDNKDIEIDLSNIIDDKSTFKRELSNILFSSLVNITKIHELVIDLIVICEHYSLISILPKMSKAKKQILLKEDINDVYIDYEHRTYKYFEEITLSSKQTTNYVTMIKKDIVEDIIEVFTKMRASIRYLYTSASYLASKVVERKEKVPFIYVKQHENILDIVSIKDKRVISMTTVVKNNRDDISFLLESIKNKFFTFDDEVKLIFNNVKCYCALEYVKDDKKDDNRFKSVSFISKKGLLRGFTLVEVIVSLALLSLSITTIFLGFQISSRINQKNREISFAYQTVKNIKEVFFSSPSSFENTFIKICGGDFPSSSSFSFDKNGNISNESSYYEVNYIYSAKEESSYYSFALEISSFKSITFNLINDFYVGEICLTK